MDAETKKLIDDAVKEATSGLATKNKELLKDLKTTNEKFSKFDGVDIDSLMSAATELEKLKNDKMEKDGEYKQLLDKAKEEHALEIKKLQDDKASVEQKYVSNKKTGELARELAGIKVIPELLDVAITSLVDKVSLDKEEKVIAGDKPVADFVKDWAQTPVGKHFIMNGNSGGGGEGGDDSTNSNAKFFDKKHPEFSLTEQAKLANRNEAEYTALKKQYK